MTELKMVDAPLSVFDEARQQIAEWEKEHPDSMYIVLALDAPEDLIVTIAGGCIRTGYAVGLCTMAAQVMSE